MAVMRWTDLRWALPAIMVSMAPNPARAGERGVAVAPPAVTGQEADHVVDALAQGVRDGLAQAGVEVAEAPEGCADATCLAEATSSGQMRGYVTTEVSITGSDYTMTVDILGPDGGSLARRDGSCEICTYEEAAVAMKDLVAEAASELGPPPVATGTVTIGSNPPGATVMVDGTAVGTTPLETSLDEGPHAVELSLEGYTAVQQEVIVVGGEAQAVDVELTKARGGGFSPRTAEIVAWSAIGVGAAVLAGGIALLVLDENPVRSNCSGVHVDSDGDCEFRYNTLGGGIGLTVTGLAVAGGGVGLYLWNRKRDSGASGTEVALVPGGVRLRF